MTRKVLLLCSLLVLASGCGPTVGIKAGLREVGANIFFGAQEPPPAPPPVVLPRLPSFPAPIELPPMSIPTGSVQPPCPAASPLTFPKLQAYPTPTGTPSNGIYPFRYVGRDTIDPGKPDQKMTTLDGSGTRQIKVDSEPTATNPGYSYTQIETFNGWVMSNTYEVYPTGPSPTALSSLGQTPAAGVYLVSQSATRVGQSAPTWQFNPVPPIQIMTFPAQLGATWQGGGGSDGTTTMSVDSNSMDANSSIVTALINVNACGTVLQAWETKIAGSIASVVQAGGNSKTYELVVDWGTQYGAISLQDHLILSQTDSASGKPEVYEVTATINVTPGPAR